MMRDELVRLADKLDQEGKHDLADAVDQTLQATAAGRPKAPLKNLDEDVKKDLLKFVHRVKENISDSMEALEELFGRLRYFDITDDVKDLGLDKVLKELEKNHDAIDGAFGTMYSRTHGKKPSKSDIEQMAEDFGGKPKLERNPLEFFESQSNYRDPLELEKREEEGLRELEQETMPEEEEGLDEELDSFWEDVDYPDPDETEESEELEVFEE